MAARATGTPKNRVYKAKAKPGDKRLGNCFYLLRTKVGTNCIFETPEDMKQAAIEYFLMCDNNPIYRTDFRGKDVTEVKIPLKRVYTIEGLCNFLDVNTDYFNDFYNRKKDLEDEKSKDFIRVIKWIRATIYQNKFEGAACGELNPVIISRDLGLKDQVENKIDASDQFLELMKRANNGQ